MKSATVQPYSLPHCPQKEKLVPQGSIECYVKMGSAVEIRKGSEDASSVSATESFAEDSCDGRASLGRSAGTNRQRGVMRKLESSLEFGGDIETSLEFGGMRETSLDFRGSSPSTVSPRGNNAKGFNVYGGGCGGHELECLTIQEREECTVSFVGTNSKCTVGNISNE